MMAIKQTFTSLNKLYGGKQIDGYGKRGLVVHKAGKAGWTISQASSGMQIRATAIYSTRTEAFKRMDALLELPVHWMKPFDEMSQEVAAVSDQIRGILQ